MSLVTHNTTDPYTKSYLILAFCFLQCAECMNGLLLSKVYILSKTSGICCKVSIGCLTTPFSQHLFLFSGIYSILSFCEYCLIYTFIGLRYLLLIVVHVVLTDIGMLFTFHELIIRLT